MVTGDIFKPTTLSQCEAISYVDIPSFQYISSSLALLYGQVDLVAISVLLVVSFDTVFPPSFIQFKGTYLIYRTE